MRGGLQAEISYVVVVRSKRFVGLAVTFSSIFGPGTMRNEGRYPIVDLERGQTVAMATSMLTAEGKAKLEKLVAAEMRRSFGATKLTDIGFSTDEPPVAAAALYVSREGLVVQFDKYALGGWAIGRPQAVIAAIEARPLFARSALVDALLGEPR